MTEADRGHWGSRLGFILAATGSAVGLGNIWKFPYITGEYGGGVFVLVYLVCIALVGLPVLIAEVIIGRAAQLSPASAFDELARREGRKPMPLWGLVGWLGVLSGFVILSFYSVVAGWSLHYTYLAMSNSFSSMDAKQIEALFGQVFASAPINLFWHTVVMGVTVSIVLGGVRGGIETAVKFLMPALLILMAGLFVDGLLQPGFWDGLMFVFAPRAENMTTEGFLEALGHAFFTLSLGMGAMLTYGSYLRTDDDVPGSSFAIAIMDTFVALAACMIIFPVIFSFDDLEPSAGPGLVFVSIPVALSQLTAGPLLNLVFFALLFFAALSSAISLLEVVASTAIDKFGWNRRRATLLVALLIYLVGIPSALTGSTEVFSEGWASIFGKSYFDSFDWLSSAVLLPLGGFLIAVYAGWVLPEDLRRDEFCRGSTFASQYGIWLFFVRWVSPVAILIVFVMTLAKEFESEPEPAQDEARAVQTERPASTVRLCTGLPEMVIPACTPSHVSGDSRRGADLRSPRPARMGARGSKRVGPAPDRGGSKASRPGGPAPGPGEHQLAVYLAHPAHPADLRADPADARPAGANARRPPRDPTSRTVGRRAGRARGPGLGRSPDPGRGRMVGRASGRRAFSGLS